MPQPFLAVVGHTNIDVQLRLHELPVAGESRPVSDRRTVHGGTACNVARHAAGLGVPVRLWSRVGPDFPPDWKVGLEADGVDLAFFDMGGSRTPTCYVLTDDQDRQSYCMDQGAMTPPYSLPTALLDGVSWLHVGTGDPASYEPLVRAAGAAGVSVGFDPGQEIHFAYDAQSFERMLNLADVFFCNDVELGRALSYLRYGAADQLLDHVDTVVATHGAKGAALYRSRQKPVQLAALPATVVDPTGAGDALRAGWYAGLAAGEDAPAALLRGMAAAAVVVGHPGPQNHVVRRDEVEERLGALHPDVSGAA